MLFAKLTAVPSDPPQEGKVHILKAAEKEIGKMLQENLLQKFKTTEKFKEINEMMLSMTASNIST